MDREAFLFDVEDSEGNAKVGASVTVKIRASGSNATVYSTETGTGTISNPLSSDVNGRVTGWLDRGAYLVTIAGSGIVSYTFPHDSSPASDGAVDLAWIAPATLPIGGIMSYAGSADPAGGFWLICDGRAVSRSAYSGLYSVIGVTFGSGDGTTTFNLPDTRGQVLIGAGTGIGLTARARGTMYGEERHALSTSELPAHSHPVNPGTYDGIVSKASAGNGTGFAFGGGWELQYAHDTGLTGSGTPHNVLQPSLCVNFIVRAK